jgi:hypothetical protein
MTGGLVELPPPLRDQASCRIASGVIGVLRRTASSAAMSSDTPMPALPEGGAHSYLAWIDAKKTRLRPVRYSFSSSAALGLARSAIQAGLLLNAGVALLLFLATLARGFPVTWCC